MVGEPTEVDGDTAAACLLNVPTARGWSGDSDDHKIRWMTVGTGNLHREVIARQNEVAVEGRGLEEQWEDWARIATLEADPQVLTPELIDYARTTKFQHFICPHCEAII